MCSHAFQILWVHSVTCLCVPASLPCSVTCIITGNNFFLKLTASFFATYSQTFSSTPTPAVLFIVVLYLVIRRTYWLTGKTVVRRMGVTVQQVEEINCQLLRYWLFCAIFLSQFCTVPNILDENKFQYFMRINILNLDFSRSAGDFTYWIKS